MSDRYNPLVIGASVVFSAWLYQQAHRLQAERQSDGDLLYKSLFWVPDDMEKIEYKPASQSKLAMWFQHAFYGVMKWVFTPPQITVRDARNYDLDYAETGFTLLQDIGYEPEDWTNMKQQDQWVEVIKEEIRKLHPNQEFESIIVYPGTFLRRGGPGENPPAVDGFHVDYYQDLDKYNAYSDYSLDVDMIIGVWKPIDMHDPIQDTPLAMIDGRTFKLEDHVPTELHMTHLDGMGKPETFKSMSGSLKHSTDYKMYYYSKMRTNEVLIFRHYTKGDVFANPHGAISEPDFPAGAETRRSIENRVYIKFKKN